MLVKINKTKSSRNKNVFVNFQNAVINKVININKHALLYTALYLLENSFMQALKLLITTTQNENQESGN
jgi:hypothetical protein